MKSVIQTRSEHLPPVSASHPLECGGNYRPLGFGSSPVRAGRSGLRLARTRRRFGCEPISTKAPSPRCG